MTKSKRRFARWFTTEVYHASFKRVFGDVVLFSIHPNFLRATSLWIRRAHFQDVVIFVIRPKFGKQRQVLVETSCCSTRLSYVLPPQNGRTRTDNTQVKCSFDSIRCKFETATKSKRRFFALYQTELRFESLQNGWIWTNDLALRRWCSLFSIRRFLKGKGEKFILLPLPFILWNWSVEWDLNPRLTD